MTVIEESIDTIVVQPRRRCVSRPRPAVALSEREVEVLLAWFASDSKDGAARLLYISPATVATHISRVRAKYTVTGRAARTKTALFARFLEDGYTRLQDW